MLRGDCKPYGLACLSSDFGPVHSSMPKIHGLIQCALRLLELPDSAREWVQVLLRMLLKYRTLVRPGQLASELVDASKSIRELQALLRDPIATRFLVVTRASDVPRLETERLLDRLRRLRLSVAAVVINARTLAPGRCPRCSEAFDSLGRAVQELSFAS